MKLSEAPEWSRVDLINERPLIDPSSQLYNEKKLHNLILSSKSWEQFIETVGVQWASYMEAGNFNIKGIIKDFYFIMPYLRSAFEKGFREYAKKANISSKEVESILNTSFYGFKILDLAYIFIPESAGKSFAVSNKNAAGLFQFLAGTWQEYSKHGFKDPKYRFDPIIAAEAAGAYFSHLFFRFNRDPLLATVAYNGGPGRVGDAKNYKDFFDNYIFKKAKQKFSSSAFVENAYYPPKFVGTIMALTDKNFFKNNNDISAYSSFYSLKPIDFYTVKITRQSAKYTVRKGDTFFSIAKKHRVNVNELMSFNDFSTASAKMLREGMTLAIPQKFDVMKEAYKALEKEARLRGLDLNYLKEINKKQINAAYRTGTLILVIPKNKVEEDVHPPPVVSQRQLAKEKKEKIPAIKKDESKIFGRTFVHYNASTNTTYISHTVKRGQTLYSIALNYGVGVDDLLKWNKKNLSQIKEGEILLVRLGGKWNEVGTIKPGDTFYELKEKLGDIFILGSSSNLISPGEKIFKRIK